MIAMVLQELEPERIEKDQGDALVTFDPASDLGGDISEVPHTAHCCRSFRPAGPETGAGERVLAAWVVPPRGGGDGQSEPLTKVAFRQLGRLDRWVLIVERASLTHPLSCPLAARWETRVVARVMLVAA
jgi:hypothetical protein